VADYFDLFQPERNAIHAMLAAKRLSIRQKDANVSGFNVDAGEGAGQTIFSLPSSLNPTTKRRR